MSEREKQEDARARGAPDPELQREARRLWRHDSVPEQQVMRYVAYRSWLRGQRGVQLTPREIGNHLSASEATARRVVAKLVAKGRLEIEPRFNAWNQQEPSMYVPAVPYTGSGPPPSPQTEEADAATSASQLAVNTRAKSNSSRDHSTTNAPGSATLPCQNTHGDKPANPSARVAAPREAQEESEDQEP